LLPEREPDDCNTIRDSGNTTERREDTGNAGQDKAGRLITCPWGGSKGRWKRGMLEGRNGAEVEQW
jgi:hypothetical protein